MAYVECVNINYPFVNETYRGDLRVFRLLYIRHTRFNGRNDLHPAIELARDCEDSLGLYSASLAINLVERFQQMVVHEDIVAALVNICRAVTTGASDDPLRMRSLDALGSTLLMRYGGKAEMGHMLTAIGAKEAAQ